MAAVAGALGGPRGGAVRPRRGAARRVHRAARRAAARRAAGRRDARRAAPGHRPRDHPRRRALPRAREARRDHQPHRRASRCPTRWRRSNAVLALGDDRPAARGARVEPARRADPRAPSATRAPARARSPRRGEPSLEAFLPRRGEGLVLSASDIDTYRTCPLKYKFARVFRIPNEPTLNQRFGIVVHQVLERYHQSGGGSVDELLGLLDAVVATRRPGRRRRGAPAAREGRDRAAPLRGAPPDRGRRAGLVREVLHVPAGPAHAARARRPRRPPARGRLRADRLQDRPPEERGAAARRRAAQPLRARRARGVGRRVARCSPTSTCSTTRRSRCPAATSTGTWIGETVLEVADGIGSQGFEPTPSYAACAICDYRIACPARPRYGPLADRDPLADP